MPLPGMRRMVSLAVCGGMVSLTDPLSVGTVICVPRMASGKLMWQWWCMWLFWSRWNLLSCSSCMVMCRLPGVPPPAGTSPFPRMENAMPSCMPGGSLMLISSWVVWRPSPWQVLQYCLIVLPWPWHVLHVVLRKICMKLWLLLWFCVPVPWH